MKTVFQSQMKNYENYVLELIQTLRPYLIFIITLLCAGIVLGFTDYLNINEFIDSIIKNLINTFKHYRGFELFFRILFNNSRVAALMIISGLLLAIFPTLGTLVNGMIIGFFFQSPQLMAGRSPFLIFIQLLPHGVFEIPALILSLALGVKLGGWLFRKQKSAYLKNNLKESFSCYVKVILPLLIIAACIETIGIETIYHFYGK